MKWIDVLPRLGRRAAAQVLVRSQFVVPMAEVDQQCIDSAPVPQAQPLEHAFQGSEQALNAPVLPGAVNVTALMGNAQPLQTPREHPSGEAGFVVRAHKSRPSPLRDGQTQVSQQRPAAFVRKPSKPHSQPAAVIDDAQDGVNLAVHIGSPGHVQTPAMVDGSRFGRSTANGLARLSHRQHVLPQHPVHVGLADSHLAMREHAVEGQRDEPATSLRQMSLQQHQLAQHPGRFVPGRPADASGFNAMGIMGRSHRVNPTSKYQPPPRCNDPGAARQSRDPLTQVRSFGHRNHRLPADRMAADHGPRPQSIPPCTP